jgi:Ca2+-binding EF-hand superfamily protein
MKVVPRYNFYNKTAIRRLFREFDTNRNYVITRSEIQSQFSRWDRNNDGMISAAEMENSTYGSHKNICSQVGPLKGYYESTDHGRRL